MQPNPPEPGRLTYAQLIEKIESGMYQIPKFQRNFVWKIDDVLGLLDSVIRGFPVGAFTLWETRGRLNAHKGFGGVVFKQPPENDSVSYVLDGQQRMTSLYLAAKGINLDRMAFDRIHVDFDKDSGGEKPVCIVGEPERGALFKKVSALKAVEFARMLNDIQKEYGDDVGGKAMNIHEAIANYPFAIVKVSTDSLGRVAWMFERLNRGGRELKPFEIVGARVYDEGRNDEGESVVKFDLEDKFKRSIKHIGDHISGYQISDDDKSKNFVLQTVASVVGKDVRRESIYDISKQDFISNWDKSLECLQLAAAFVKLRLHVPMLKMLPYSSMLTPIAYFYYKNGMRQPTPQQVTELGKFFYRAAFGQRYVSGVEAKLNQDLALMDNIFDGTSVNWADSLHVPDATEVGLVKLLMEDFSPRNAAHKAVLCVLAAKEPKRFDDANTKVMDGQGLHPTLSKNYHHFFPKGNPKWKTDASVNAVANITLLDAQSNQRIKNRCPSVYIPEFEGEHPENSCIADSLESHFINVDKDGIRDDDIDKFLANRSGCLAREILKKIGE